MVNEIDLANLRTAIALAHSARNHGNQPFGAVLTDLTGVQLLDAENTVLTDHDCTAHAELNLVRKASQRLDASVLATATIYCSTEPCLMCTGAIYWSGISRIVYALGQHDLHSIASPNRGTTSISPPCRELLARGNRTVTVHGPALEQEARAVHTDFWHPNPR